MNTYCVGSVQCSLYINNTFIFKLIFIKSFILYKLILKYEILIVVLLKVFWDHSMHHWLKQSKKREVFNHSFCSEILQNVRKYLPDTSIISQKSRMLEVYSFFLNSHIYFRFTCLFFALLISSLSIFIIK